LAFKRNNREQETLTSVDVGAVEDVLPVATFPPYVAQDLSNGAIITEDAQPETFEDLLNRLAQIEDELKSRGLVDLLKEKETLRTTLKDAMIAEELLTVIDEASGYEAKLSPSTSEVYDPVILRTALLPGHAQLVIKETVDGKALESLIRMGVTTRTTLEKMGAISKKLKSVSLLVRPHKEAEEEAPE